LEKDRESGTPLAAYPNMHAVIESKMALVGPLPSGSGGHDKNKDP
jgi:hypothetical protein